MSLEHSIQTLHAHINVFDLLPGATLQIERLIRIVSCITFKCHRTLFSNQPMTVDSLAIVTRYMFSSGLFGNITTTSRDIASGACSPVFTASQFAELDGVAASAQLYFIGMIEYLSADILQLYHDCAIETGVYELNPSCISKLMEDHEMSTFFTRFHVHFLGAPVPMSLRHTNRQAFKTQSKHGVILPASQFLRLMHHYTSDTTITRQAVLACQLYLEYKLVHRLSRLKRSKVTTSALKLIFS